MGIRNISYLNSNVPFLDFCIRAAGTEPVKLFPVKFLQFNIYKFQFLLRYYNGNLELKCQKLTGLSNLAIVLRILVLALSSYYMINP